MADAPPADTPPNWSEVSPIGDTLIRAATLAPDRDALVLPGERVTFAELYAGALGVSRALWALGVRPGDSIGVLAPNSPEYAEGFFGGLLIGAVVVPLNIRHKSRELAYVIEHARIAAVVTTDRVDEHVELAGVLADALPSLSGSSDARALELAEAPALRGILLLKGAAKAGCLDEPAWQDLAGRVEPAVVERARVGVRVRDPALILYTSGTTARPKGCVLSHEAMTRGPGWRGRHRFVTEAAHEVYWGPGPLFHVGALSPYVGSVAACATWVTDVYFDAERALRMLEQERVTSAWPWFPAFTVALLDHPSFDPGALAPLRFIGQIGPRALFERIREELPHVEIFKSSGMTEAAGSFGLSEASHTFEDRVVAQGVPVPGVEVRIVEPGTDTDLPRGEAGELLIRGYCVMDGYFRDPAATARALDEQRWLRTGDLYSHRPDGHLVFGGRLKDMIKVGGENVAALEVEAFLSAHPAVRAVEVVGIPDDRLDEVPVAFVELRDGFELNPQELAGFCAGRIASYKVPRAVFSVARDDWPMSATKVDKRELRRRALDELTPRS